MFRGETLVRIQVAPNCGIDYPIDFNDGDSVFLYYQRWKAALPKEATSDEAWTKEVKFRSSSGKFAPQVASSQRAVYRQKIVDGGLPVFVIGHPGASGDRLIEPFESVPDLS
jgi:hypothetical protein